jgi:hypothetical protein
MTEWSTLQISNNVLENAILFSTPNDNRFDWGKLINLYMIFSIISPCSTIGAYFVSSFFNFFVQ